MLTRVLSIVVAGVAVAGCATDADGPATSELPAGDALLMGQPSCAEAARRLGRDLGDYELRAPMGEPVDLAFDAMHGAVVTASADGRSIDWRSDLGVDAVLVAGGRRTQAYVYDPEAREDAELTAPRSKLGVAPPVGEVVFCYDRELAFDTLAAKTSLVRTQHWSMELYPERTDITVPVGVVKSMGFRAAVAPTDAVDSGWRARGEVVLENPNPAPVEVVAIGDAFHEMKVTVHCVSKAAGLVVPAFGALRCTWSADLPDGGAHTLALEAVTRGEIGPARADLPIDFAGAEVIAHDGRAWVWDDHAGFLGLAEGAHAFTFELPLGPYKWCPSVGIFLDGATLYGHDTGRQVQARTWLRVKVPCE